MSLFSSITPRQKVPVKLALYLDSGKGNARGAVVSTRKGLPHVLYTIAGEERIGDGVDIENYTPSLASLNEILSEIARVLQAEKGPGEPQYVAEEVYCILGAPFYLTHTASITYKSPSPVTISPKLLKSIIDNARGESLPAHLSSQTEGAQHVLHERITEVKINGYHSSEPYGKTAETISVSLFRTQIHKEFYLELTKLIKKYTPAPVFIEPLSLAAFTTIRNRVDAENDFAFITVGNEITEVSLVREHTLLETVSFPFGKHSLVRHLARKLSLNYAEAMSRLALFHDKKLHDEEAAIIAPHLEGAQAEWFSYLENTLVTLSQEASVPAIIYLVVDTDLKDVFESISAKQGFASQSLVPEGFTIKMLDTARFADCCTFGLNIRFDTLLAISSTFAHAAKSVISELYPQKP